MSEIGLVASVRDLILQRGQLRARLRRGIRQRKLVVHANEGLRGLCAIARCERRASEARQDVLVHRSFLIGNALVETDRGRKISRHFRGLTRGKACRNPDVPRNLSIDDGIERSPGFGNLPKSQLCQARVVARVIGQRRGRERGLREELERTRVVPVLEPLDTGRQGHERRG